MPTAYRPGVPSVLNAFLGRSGGEPDGVAILSSAQTHDIVTVLSDAFYDYPVMRYVLGPSRRMTSACEHWLVCS